MKKIDLGLGVQIGILVVMAIGLGITIGYNSQSNKVKALEAQVETFDFANKSNLRDLLASLQTASKELTDSLLLSEENQKLKEGLSIANDQNTKLLSENNDLKNKYEYLNELVKTKYGDTGKFRLKPSVTKCLFGNQIILSWQRELYISGIDLTINNESKNINVGNFREFKINGENYKLILDSIDAKTSEAIFVYSK